ncbi:MAG: Na/Pi cotransporter family protein [Suipraeoptans sp.]
MSTIVIMLLGGLGLFLFGIKLMSDGLEKAAGARMRKILEFFTSNRFKGMLVGIVVTAIIQSSSATTVMVVSFVNSGLMNLMQAAGVILGANIGTTVTGQLIAFNLSDIAPLVVFAGAMMMLFAKKINVSRAGEIVLGFGILFMGLSTMSGAMSSLKESEHIVSVLQSVSSPFLAMLIGFALTAILQSSSATVGIIILMATQGLLQFDICPYLILGCNVGSCVSAMIASFGGKKDAKRAAWIHFLVNIIGSVVLFVVFTVAVTPITNAIMSFSGANAARAVANLHTAIKLAEVVILFPFMTLIVKATYKIVPGADPSSEDKFELKYIGEGTMLTPATAVVDAIREIEHMGEVAISNVKVSLEALSDLDEKKINKVYETEEYVDYLNKKITDYLVKANELELPVADAQLAGGLFHVVNDIERIGDHAENFADAAKQRKKRNVTFTDKGSKQLKDMGDMTLKILDYSLDMFSNKNPEHMQEILDLEDAIDKKEKKLQRAHVKRIAKGECSAEAGMIYSDVASGLERIGDHATNIAFAILKPEDYEEDEEA